MAEYDELAELVRLAAPPFEVPVGLEERVFARIAPPRAPPAPSAGGWPLRSPRRPPPPRCPR